MIMSRMRVERAERGQPLPERVTSLLNQPQPVRTTRLEHFVGDDPNNEHLRKRYILENTELLKLCSSSRTRPQRDEFLVAYEKPKRRGLYVWEVICSAHRNQTIQGLVRVEVWSEDAVQATPASGLTLAVNVRRTLADSDRTTSVYNDTGGSHYLIIVDMLADEPTISWARNSRLITQEPYRCDNRSFYLFLLEVEVEQDYEVTTQFRGVCTDPLSLERLCRLVVRNCLSLVDQLDAVELLPLPVILKDFIQQPDKISDEIS